MSATIAPIVVLGVGNELLGDDGVGLRVLDGLGRIAAHDPALLPPCTRLLDGGTLGLDLMHAIEGARAVLLLDAADIGADPGEVVVLSADAITGAGGHRPGGPSGGLGELLALGRFMDWFTGPVMLVGVQLGQVGFSARLTPAIEAAVPAAVEAALEALRALDADAPHHRRHEPVQAMETVG